PPPSPRKKPHLAPSKKLGVNYRITPVCFPADRSSCLWLERALALAMGKVAYSRHVFRITGIA
ncbi:MAG: hypothetical protein LBV12_02185, partial [Puniceicoccales bacterium]|nr:hypothetical protein [Puniceicoccales bacterium]